MPYSRWFVYALVTTGAIALSHCSTQHEFTGYACPAIIQVFDKFLNYPQLQSATSYTVLYSATSTAPCPPGYASDGTFTTQ